MRQRLKPALVNFSLWNFGGFAFHCKAVMKASSILKKLVSCLVAALTVIALLLLLGNGGTLPWFPPPLVFSLIGLCLLTALFYPFIWQQQERKQKVATYNIYGFLNTLIRYALAFNLASFGWKKIFGLQFVVPPAIAAVPLNQQSGEWLTWFYFGYSPAFGLLLALFQIAGACLLLFRQTVLPAAVALFAFMLPLTLINVFYGLNAGALTQAVLLTTGLAYLILEDYQRLKIFFLKTLPGLPSLPVKSRTAKNIVRLSALLLSLLFTLYLKSNMH